MEKNPKKLIIIEKDFDLYKKLLKNFDKTNITIINDDALIYDFSKLSNYILISNLPYNISSKFLLKTIKFNKNFTDIVCMIQSELADKLNYKKGKMNKYKFLSQKFGKFEVKFNVSANVFYPKPKVKSTVVLFKRNKNIDKDQERLKYFFNFFFINKRKKIKSNKYFKNNISNKYLNYRYEELNYQSLLDIYHRFKLPVS